MNGEGWMSAIRPRTTFSSGAHRLFLMLGLCLSTRTEIAAGQQLARRGAAVDSVAAAVEQANAKNPLLAAVEVTAINAVAVTMNRYYYGTAGVAVGPETWRKNLELGFEWDMNPFRANYVEHPMAGSLYFNAGRVNGMDFWESLPLVAGGSLQFELFGEPNRPSLNDFMMTTMGGVSLGEASYRLSSLILDNQASGAERVAREVTATVVSPLRGVHRLLSGRATSRSANPQEWRPDWLVGHVDLGSRTLGGSGTSESSNDLFLDLELEYGDAASGEVSQPFDAFRIEALVVSVRNRPLERLAVLGNLLGRDLYHGRDAAHRLLVALNYEYNQNQSYTYGQNNVTLGIQSVWPLLGAMVVRSHAALDWVILGAAGTSQVPRPGSYDFGTGGGAKLDLAVYFSRTRLVRVSYETRWLHTVSGNYDNHRVERLVGQLALPLYRGLGVGFEANLYRQDSYGGGLPSDSFEVPEIRLSLSWTGA